MGLWQKREKLVNELRDKMQALNNELTATSDPLAQGMILAEIETVDD